MRELGMRIVSEIGWGHKPGGAIRVAVNAIRRMTELEPQHEHVVLSNSTHPDLTYSGVRQIRLAPPPGVPQLVWDQFLFPHAAVPLKARALNADVLYWTNNIISIWPSRIPAVVVIHDMTPFLLSDSFHAGHGAYQRAYFRLAARKAQKIITVSQNSKSDICRILGVADAKVVVAPLASSLGDSAVAVPIPDIEERLGLRLPYVLYVGAIHPRKNVGRILAAFADLKQQRGIPHQLVIAGPPRWMPTVPEDAGRLAALGANVLFTGAVGEADLIALYRHASVLVYPSLYEGFGLPVLEGMSFGTPVVTSNVSSLPEVAGDAARLVDPLNTDDIAEAIWEIVSQPALAAALRRRGLERAGTFSWERHARIVLDTIEAAAG